MKRALIPALLLVLIFSGGAAQAALPNPGLTPGSPFYGLDRAQEQLTLALTFNQEARAERKLNFAEERLSEARLMLERNRSQKAAELARRYGEQAGDVRKEARQMQQRKQNRVMERLNNTAAFKALNQVMQKVPAQARKGIQTALQRSGIPEFALEKGVQPGPVRDNGSGYTATGTVAKPANRSAATGSVTPGRVQ